VSPTEANPVSRGANFVADGASAMTAAVVAGVGVGGFTTGETI